MNWGDGDYELTAAALEAVAVRAVEAAEIGAGTRVLDLGAGTGNAALEAARRGAEALAVDPAPRLLAVCRQRAAAEGLAVATLEGDASRIPASDASIDVLVSIFAVIFAPDAEAAAREMLRVVRPGGRVVVTSWTPRGPIAEAGRILGAALLAFDPGPPARAAPPAWGDPAFVRDLFQSRGASVRIEECALAFEAESPEAWFDEQVRHHPYWRFGHRALEAVPQEWERVRRQSIEALRAGSEDPARMRVTSHYLLAQAIAGS